MTTVDFSESLTRIGVLVRHYRAHRARFEDVSTTEADIRAELIDGFFEALGWDVADAALAPPQYRDVLVESILRVGSSKRAPDYTFRHRRQARFFVEVKAPHDGLERDKARTFQLRRYGYSGGLPLSILTSFREFRVCDCTTKPLEPQAANYRQLRYLTWEEYEKQWDWVYRHFSHDAVSSGRFDAIVAEKSRHGTTRVDADFLETIEEWRAVLARDVIARNQGITQEDLNRVVQLTIDRIIFLRMAEDHGLEGARGLWNIVGQPGVYRRFIDDICVKADRRYGSGLFHGDDTLTRGVSISDEVMARIITNLYFDNGCPYDFRVLPVEVLGSTYEHFLSRTISLDGGAPALVDKPEIKKQGGVFYTPNHIVEDIVGRTIGCAIAGRDPRSVRGFGSSTRRPIRIADIACGSGSFLVYAYQFLLDYFLRYYVEDDPERHARERRLWKHIAGAGGDKAPWRLTMAEKRRILLDHIFGVDIDAQAVEVAKLSLLLKCLESAELEEGQQRIFDERVLPDIDGNIRVGNSLVDSTADLGFDFGQAFAEVFSAGGFDVIIGNPPYVLFQNMDNDRGHELIRAMGYVTDEYKTDTYQLFMERALRLLRPGGHFGFITPSTYLANHHSGNLRRLLLDETTIGPVVNHGYPVFKASVDTCTTIARRTPSRTGDVLIYRSPAPRSEYLARTIEVRRIRRDEGRRFILPGNEDQPVIDRMRSGSRPLGEVATAYFGMQTHDRRKHVAAIPPDRSWVSVLDGTQIHPHFTLEPIAWASIASDAIKSGGDPEVYARPRVGVRQIGRAPIAAVLPDGQYTLNTVYNIYYTSACAMPLLTLQAIINSKAIRYFWLCACWDEKNSYPKIKKPELLSIPIPRLLLEGDAINAGIEQAATQAGLFLHQAFAMCGQSGADAYADQGRVQLDRIDAILDGIYGLTAADRERRSRVLEELGDAAG